MHRRKPRREPDFHPVLSSNNRRPAAPRSTPVKQARVAKPVNQPARTTKPAKASRPARPPKAANASVAVERHPSLAAFIIFTLVVILISFLIGTGISGCAKRNANLSDHLEIHGTFAGMDTPEEEATEATDAIEATTENQNGYQEAKYEAPVSDDIWMPEGCVALAQDQNDLHSGMLLQLDAATDFSGTIGTLTDFSEKNDSYRVNELALEIQPEALEALNALARAYEDVNQETNLLIYSTTKPNPSERSMYPEIFPDRATGYAVDFSILNEDGTISSLMDPLGWLDNNSWRYGFIRPYKDACFEQTGIDGAGYHYRYVGKASAAIMHEEGLNFCDYLNAVRRHTLQDPFTYDDGNDTWYIYFVPASSTNTTNVPVPRHGNYTISGNNTDGYIVTSRGSIN